MDAELILRERYEIDERAFAELIVWRVPQQLEGSAHNYKYRLAFVVDETCVIRYDNEAGKGDHRHVGRAEHDYRFTTIDDLLVDFWTDVDQWKR